MNVPSYEFLKLRTVITGILQLCVATTISAFPSTPVTPPPDSLKIFYLGEIVIPGAPTAAASPFPQTILSQHDFELQHGVDASHALGSLPGLSRSAVGGRNESMIYIRGFDLRQVPVFIDGIPEYVPYDGYVDLARFTTYDLSEITVSKGFSSVLYGANAMGGAINLVSRRPAATLEYDLMSGGMSSGGTENTLRLGTNQHTWYLSGSASRLHQNSFPMSGSFLPSRTENGGERDNSYRTDTKFSIRAGVTPNETDEYSFTTMSQQGDKGNPVYTGNNPSAAVRYWQWPDWDKTSQYFISQTVLGDRFSGGNVLLKTRLFHDRFTNTLFAYDNAMYSTQTKRSSFRSYYDDDSWGAAAQASGRWFAGQHVTLSAQWKHDIHREHNLGEPVRTVRDATISAGAEDLYRLSGRFSIVGGVSYDLRKELQAQDYNGRTRIISDIQPGDTHAWNAQIGGTYDISADRQVFFSIARKTRFATMKDRYSYKLGTAIPNPGLMPEQAVNYDLAYRELLEPAAAWVKASFFDSELRDVIQLVSNVQGNLSQTQNLGHARYYGCEVEAEATPMPGLRANAQYTYLRRENISNPAIQFLDTPEHDFSASTVIGPVSGIEATAGMEYSAERKSTSDGRYTAAPFALFNLSVSCHPAAHIILDAGIQNLFDRNYALTEGFPEPGRELYANIRIAN